MTNYEFERSLVYIAEQIIKTFGNDVGVQEPKQEKTEFLIMDEKVRKAIKVWAEANRITEDSDLYFAKDEERGLSEIIDNFTGAKIRFYKIIPNLKQYEFYTINELCG